MKQLFKKHLVLSGFLSLIILSGCGSADRDVQTPVGSRPGDQFGNFDIIGISSKVFVTKNLADSKSQYIEKIKINVPPGTFMIIPAVRGWVNCYGKMTPDDLSNINDLNGKTNWQGTDHHFGLQILNIWVEDIDAVDPSTNTQTATIGFGAILSDDNSDDPWFAQVNYSLIFLGKHPITANAGIILRDTASTNK